MWHREWKRVVLGVSLFGLVLSGGTEAAPTNGVDLQFSLPGRPVTVTVSGKVTDKGTSKPVAGALVRGHIVVWKYDGPDLFERCPSSATRTDAQGQYSLQLVTPLTTSGPRKGKDGLCVYVSAPGYETKPIYPKPDVTPESTKYPDLNFELEPGRRVAGTVVDAAGQPVSEAVIRLQDSQNGDWNFFGALGRTTTNDQGQFELWIGKTAQRPWLDVSKLGQGASFFWENLDTGAMGTLVLGRGGCIQGRIVDHAGKGVAGCEISVRGFPCGLIDKVLTDSEGNYVLRGVPGDPSLIEFYQIKNGRYLEQWGKADVRARSNPELRLADAPNYQILARDGTTVTGPELVVGAGNSISGQLTAAHHVFAFGGLLVRLDSDWGSMVEADADGRFQFPFITPGKHRLTVYLPHNRRGVGIGRVEVNMVPGQPLTDVQVPVKDLAEVGVQYLDAKGNPLPGITAGATWSADGSGVWTEGTKSDAEGWAVLYLYPGEVQYVRGFDRAGGLVAESTEKVQPRAGQILDRLRIVMVPSARLEGQFTDANGAPAPGKTARVTLSFADGIQTQFSLRPDAEGRFHMEGLTPGIVKLSVEIGGVTFTDVTGLAFELKPGAVKDLGRIVLKNGLDKKAIAREKNTHALDYAAEVHAAAEQLFEKIRTADYAHYLEKDVPWNTFPIVGFYTTDHWYDVLVPWICKTFSKNPIVKVELGEVFLNPQAVARRTNLATVPYKLTLQDGRVLEGNLPFEFTFEGTPHWHGLLGIDWHLTQPQP